MKKIRYFSSFCDSQTCKNKVELICNYVANDEYIITCDDDYTHAILLNQPMPRLTVPKENVIGFAFEPPYFLNLTPEFVSYAQANIGVYWINEKGGLPSPFREGYAFMWHIVPPLITNHHRGLCSIMVSQKRCTQGHRYRHELVEAILSTQFPVDIYGRGCSSYAEYKDARVKGAFSDDETDITMYSQYVFHIAVENGRCSYYMSEKLINPLLCRTTPLYWGCPQAAAVFPDCFHGLSGNLSQDMKFLYDVLKNPTKYIQPIDPRKIEERVNILKNLPFLFSDT